MSKQWFILSVYIGKEKKVEQKLNQCKKQYPCLFGEIIVPEIIEKDKESRIRFPGYVFAELDLYEKFSNRTKQESTWKILQTIDGIISPFGGDNTCPLSEAELKCLKDISEIKEKDKIEFNVGDVVKITDGPFANNVGIISNRDNDRKIAIVNFEMFNEKMCTEVQYSSIDLNCDQK